MKQLTLILFLALTFSFTENAESQSGWTQGYCYAEKGEMWTTYSQPYHKFNVWGDYIGTYQLQKTTVWHRKEYTGWIWLWNYHNRAWYKEWRSGWFWYYTWSTKEIFVHY
jgi:hypothetical protein